MQDLICFLKLLFPVIFIVFIRRIAINVNFAGTKRTKAHDKDLSRALCTPDYASSDRYGSAVNAKQKHYSFFSSSIIIPLPPPPVLFITTTDNNKSVIIANLICSSSKEEEDDDDDHDGLRLLF